MSVEFIKFKMADPVWQPILLLKFKKKWRILRIQIGGSQLETSIVIYEKTHFEFQKITIYFLRMNVGIYEPI